MCVFYVSLELKNQYNLIFLNTPHTHVYRCIYVDIYLNYKTVIDFSDQKLLHQLQKLPEDVVKCFIYMRKFHKFAVLFRSYRPRSIAWST